MVALKESGINPLLIICVSKYSFQKTGKPVADFEISEVQKQRQLQPSQSSQLFSRPLNLGFSNLFGHSQRMNSSLRANIHTLIYELKNEVLNQFHIPS